MRDRKEIEEHADNLSDNSKTPRQVALTRLNLEVQLDIRELLEQIKQDMPTWEMMPGADV